MVLETVPRVLGIAAGIVAMAAGAGAAAGLGGQLAGVLVAVLLSTVWIRRSVGRGRRWRTDRRIGEILAEQRHGVFSSVLSSGYASLPVVIIGALGLPYLPAYAVVDKLQKQIFVASTPFMSVVQGWLPTGGSDRVRDRLGRVVLMTSVYSCVLTVVTIVAAPTLIEWLGAGTVEVGPVAIVLLGLIAGAAIADATLSRVVLVAVGQFATMTRSTAVGSVVGLLMVGLLGVTVGLEGALAGVLLGLAIRIAWAGFAIGRQRRRDERNPAGSPSMANGT
ncbi:hypothetical protein [Paraoerskovia sediminicola]|nr:hypothetical protein [Paraoerskovia sediminicola]